jgi:hypothetical protein
MSLDRIAMRHLELLVVNQDTVIVSTPTMDSTSECFRWALENVESMGMVTHHSYKPEQHTDTSLHQGKIGHPGHVSPTKKGR